MTECPARITSRAGLAELGKQQERFPDCPARVDPTARHALIRVPDGGVEAQTREI